MPYDEEIEARIRQAASGWKNTEYKRMFGGICALLNGNMFCGVYKDYLILRLGERNGEKALESSSTRPFDITGRPMKGWVMVAKDGFKTEEELSAWLDQAREFVATLPPK